MVHKMSRIKLVISWFVIMDRSFRRSLLFFLLHPASPSDLPVLTKAKEAQGWSEHQRSPEQSLSLRDNGLCKKEIFVLQSLRRLEHSPRSTWVSTASIQHSDSEWVVWIVVQHAVVERDALLSDELWPVGLSFLSAHGSERNRLQSLKAMLLTLPTRTIRRH